MGVVERKREEKRRAALARVRLLSACRRQMKADAKKDQASGLHRPLMGKTQVDGKA